MSSSLFTEATQEEYWVTICEQVTVILSFITWKGNYKKCSLNTLHPFKLDIFTMLFYSSYFYFHDFIFFLWSTKIMKWLFAFLDVTTRVIHSIFQVLFCKVCEQIFCHGDACSDISYEKRYVLLKKKKCLCFPLEFIFCYLYLTYKVLH